MNIKNITILVQVSTQQSFEAEKVHIDAEMIHSMIQEQYLAL
jgi:hypothetical protein